jgi:hypothetical protein
MGMRLKIGSREAVMAINFRETCGRSKPVLVSQAGLQSRSALRIWNIKIIFFGCKKGAAIRRISVIRKDKNAIIVTIDCDRLDDI